MILCYECGSISPKGEHYCVKCGRHLRHWWPLEDLSLTDHPAQPHESRYDLNVQYWPFAKLSPREREAAIPITRQLLQLVRPWLTADADSFCISTEGRHIDVLLPHAAYADAQVIVDVYADTICPSDIPRRQPRPVRESSYACFPSVTLNVQSCSAVDLLIAPNGDKRLLYLQPPPRTACSHEAGKDELSWLLSVLQLATGS